MNAKQAKSIRLDDLLTSMGYSIEGRHRGGQDLWFKSPFREELESSFSVSTQKNSFYDHGDSFGGNTLDFAIRYLESRGEPASVPDALAWLRVQIGQRSFIPRDIQQKPKSKSFSFRQQANFEAGEGSKLQFVKATPIKNEQIYTYLQGRQISRALADRYLIEIHYKNLEKQRTFWGFGMANESEDGYEVRSAGDNPAFKTAFKRDISLLRGTKPSGRVNIVEGMLDALSLMEMLKTEQLSNDTIILHSLSSFSRACDRILVEGYTEINLFLDNNSAGKNATKRFYDVREPVQDERIRMREKRLLPEHIKIIDQSLRFLPHVDLNDALKNGDSDLIVKSDFFL